MKTVSRFAVAVLAATGATGAMAGESSVDVSISGKVFKADQAVCAASSVSTLDFNFSDEQGEWVEASERLRWSTRRDGAFTINCSNMLDTEAAITFATNSRDEAPLSEAMGCTDGICSTWPVYFVPESPADLEQANFQQGSVNAYLDGTSCDGTACTLDSSGSNVHMNTIAISGDVEDFDIEATIGAVLYTQPGNTSEPAGNVTPRPGDAPALYVLFTETDAGSDSDDTSLPIPAGEFPPSGA